MCENIIGMICFFFHENGYYRKVRNLMLVLYFESDTLQVKLPRDKGRKLGFCNYGTEVSQAGAATTTRPSFLPSPQEYEYAIDSQLTVLYSPPRSSIMKTQTLLEALVKEFLSKMDTRSKRSSKLACSVACPDHQDRYKPAPSEPQ